LKPKHNHFVQLCIFPPPFRFVSWLAVRRWNTVFRAKTICLYWLFYWWHQFDSYNTNNAASWHLIITTHQCTIIPLM